MDLITLQTTIEPGPDRQVDQLFRGPGRKLMQITLRNQGILARHSAAVPITVQCLAGEGTFLAGDDLKEEVRLTPGVLVTLDPNVPHEVRATPAVSILVTQFIGQ